MQVTFWGTRGSLAKPGLGTVRYGGNTSCVQIQSASGTLVLLDCGTGAHALGQELLAQSRHPIRGHVLISHTHWDHIQGLPFFTPLFVPGNEWDIYGPRGSGGSLRETLAGQMQYTYFPVTLDALGAKVAYHSLVEGSLQVGDIDVRCRYLNHPALTLGYRMEVDGVVVVYACDHEPHARERAVSPGEITGQDLEHANFLRDADLVIHDAQYTAEEYPDKEGWGHSTPDYALRLCRSVGVRRLALTHHDPTHTDDDLDRMIGALKAELDDGGPALELFAAAEGQVIELVAEGDETAEGHPPETPALSVESIPEARRALLCLSDSPETDLILEAAEREGVEVERTDSERVRERYLATRPSLVILDGEADGLEACRSIRGLESESARDVPIILVGARPGTDGAVSDWLVTPFSVQYARTRMRAWLFRVECRWVRAPFPDDEPERLAALRSLNVLDTKPEERFDRITRLAAALFDVPMSWVTLLDSDRQWFKSRVGLEEEETARDASFCSHAILADAPLVVPDALADDRFADSPLVTGAPHIRFYAGCPVKVDDGRTVGTLCIGDVRPRAFPPERLERLRDLADLVEVELRNGRP